MGDNELEEHRVNNDLEEIQLGDIQYKFAQRNGTYSRERTQAIIEQEMAGRAKKFVKKLITVTGIPQGKLK